MKEFISNLKLSVQKIFQKISQILKGFVLLFEKNKLNNFEIPEKFKNLGKTAFKTNTYLDLVPEPLNNLKVKLLESQKLMVSIEKKAPDDKSIKQDKIQLKKIKEDIELVFKIIGKDIFNQLKGKNNSDIHIQDILKNAERVSLVDDQLSKTPVLRYLGNKDSKTLIAICSVFILFLLLPIMIWFMKGSKISTQYNFVNLSKNQKLDQEDLKFQINSKKVDFSALGEASKNPALQKNDMDISEKTENQPTNTIDINKEKQLQNQFEKHLVLNNKNEIVGLDLGGYYFVNNELKEICERYKEIKSLNLQSSNVNNADLSNVSTLINLESLNISRTKFTDKGIRNLLPLLKLKSLDLSFTEITDRGIDELIALNGLTKINLAKTRITDDGITALKNLRKLTWVDLHNTNITVAILPQLVNLPSLKYVNLSNCFTYGEKFDINCFAEFKNAKSLEIFDIDHSFIRNLKMFRENGMLHKLPIAKNINGDTPLNPEDVHEVNLMNCTIKDDDLNELVAFPNLKVLNLHRTGITPGGLGNLEQLKFLNTLFIDDLPLEAKNLLQASKFYNESGISILRKIGLLHVLYYAKNSLGGRPKNNYDVEILDFRLAENNYPKHLLNPQSHNWSNQFLFLNSNNNSGENNISTEYINFINLRAIKGYSQNTFYTGKFQWSKYFPKLETIEIRGMGYFDNEQLKPFSELKNLKHFSVKGATGVPERGFDRDAPDEYPSLTLFENLKYFEFSSSNLFLETNAKYLAKLKQLDSLIILSPPVNPKILKELGTLKMLTSLTIDTDNVGLYELNNFVNLKTLDLSLCYSKISDDGIEDLGVLSKLESLNLSNSDITSNGLKYLKKLEMLTSLDLSNAKKIDDNGIENLVLLKKLKNLNLSSTDLSDKAVKELVKIKSLEILNLNKTKINDIAYRELKMNLPNCKIYIFERE